MVASPFVWGAGGQKLTQDQIDNQRKILAALVQRGDPAFNNAGWLGALGRGLEGAYEGWQDNKLKAEQNDLNTYNTGTLASRLNEVATSLSGGSALPSAASTGVGQELSATSPGLVDVSQNGDTYEPFIGAVRGTITNPYGLAAVASTGKAESGWSGGNANRTWSDPSESGQAGTAGGILSWRGPRLAALQSFARQKGEAGNGSPQTQAEFFLQEDPNLVAALNGAKSVEEAQSAINRAWAFAGHDRPGGEAGRRLQYARSYLPQLQGSTQVASASPAAAAIETVAPASGYVDPVVSTPNALPSAEVANALVPPLPARNISSAPAVTSQPVQMAQATPPRMGFDPRILAVLNDPRANEQTRNMAKLLMDRQMGEQAAAQKQYLAEQQRQQEIARRQQIAGQTGINPMYAADDALWSEAAKNAFAAPSTVTIGNNVYDTRNPSQPLITAPQAPTTGMQDYQSYADYETQAGRTPIGPLEYEQALRRSGAPTTEGAIPTGYQANRDAQGRVISLAPIPGGPEDNTKKQAIQNDQKETAGDVITNAAVRAVQALNAHGLPATGLTGRIASMNPSTNAAEVRRQVAVLGANASTENINAMRAASPTGGALGAASDADLALLKAKTGALDPDSPTFERDVKDYVHTLLRTVHGKDAGDAAFKAINWSGNNQVQTDIPGVTIRRKGQ